MFTCQPLFYQDGTNKKLQRYLENTKVYSKSTTHLQKLSTLMNPL